MTADFKYAPCVLCDAPVPFTFNGNDLRPVSEHAVFFGYRRSAGHELFLPDGRSTWEADKTLARLEYGPNGRHVDGSYAPRRGTRSPVRGIEVCWAGQGATKEAHNEIAYASEEHEQGKFLRHVNHHGYTLISWWDRTQGDGRGACNSNFYLLGEHASDVMLKAFRAHFPRLAAKLADAGVELVEVFPTGATP